MLEGSIACVFNHISMAINLIHLSTSLADDPLDVELGWVFFVNFIFLVR